MNTFEEKYEKYGKMLFKIAFVYTSNIHDTEDILQEVFLKLLYNAPHFKSDEHEKAWLIRVTINQSKDALKSSKNNDLPLDENILPSAFNESDAKLDIWKALLKLQPKYRVVTLLFYYYGYTINEISSTLHIGTSAVKMRLKRAKEQLKIELEDYGLWNRKI